MSEPRLITAPGPLKCSGCGCRIEEDARYWFWWDADKTVRMHPECYTARAEGLTQKVAS